MCVSVGVPACYYKSVAVNINYPGPYASRSLLGHPHNNSPSHSNCFRLQSCMYRVGQKRIYPLYMTVYLVISLPKLPYIHRIYIYGSGRPYACVVAQLC